MLVSGKEWRMVSGSGDGLTPRERDVLRHAAAGLTNEGIASVLGISRNAVRYHLKQIHSKLHTGGQRSRLSLATFLRMTPGT
jgi:two-component system nitrate/nitrite response regulator NarP